jgi:hypothetical protein
MQFTVFGTLSNKMQFTVFSTLSNKIFWWRKMLWSGGRLEKLAIAHLGKQSFEFHGTWRFNAAFTSCRQLSLIWARLIQSELFNLNPLNFIFAIPKCYNTYRIYINVQSITQRFIEYTLN